MIIVPLQIMLFFLRQKRYLKTKNCAEKVYPTYLWYKIGHTEERYWLNGIEVLIFGMHASNVFDRTR